MNHGIQFEQGIQTLCEKYFFPDFVFRNPFYLKGGKIKRELADMLMPLNRSIIAVQTKARAAKAPTAVLDSSRYSRQVRQGIAQFKILNELIRSRTAIRAQSSRGIELPLSFHEATEVLCILVVNEPLNRLANADPNLAKGYLESSGFPIHILSQADFDFAISRLDTLPDLLAYFQFRRHLLGRGRLIGGNGESSLVRVFRSNRKLAERIRRDESPVLEILSDVDDGLTPEKTHFQKRQDLGGQMMDFVIGGLYDVVNANATPYIPSWANSAQSGTTPEMYWMILQELASLDRLRRGQVGEKLIEKMMKADKEGFGFALVVPGTKVEKELGAKDFLLGEDAIVVLSSSLSRAERVDKLSQMTQVALMAYGLRQVIGISTNPWEVLDRHFEFVLKRQDVPVIHPEARKFVGQFFGNGYIEEQLGTGSEEIDAETAFALASAHRKNNK